MVVDVYKSFRNLINSTYLKDHYFVDSCIDFKSKHSEETNLNSFALRIFLDQNNIIEDCGERRKYCDFDALTDIEITDISSEIKTVLE